MARCVCRFPNTATAAHAARYQLFSASPSLRTLIDKAPAPAPSGEGYDPHKREPLYAHAQSSALWELVRCFFVAVDVCVYGASNHAK